MLQKYHPKRLLSVKTKERLKAARLNTVHAFRQRDADRRMLPDFVIVGAQKCGTSSLYGYLAEHPQVAPALTKEVHFFDLNYDQPVSWYQAFFPRHGASLAGEPHDGGTITGEATPYYLHHPLVANRIATMLPQIKLIVLLRNPIERTYSAYHHQVRKGREHETFEDAIQLESVRTAGELEKLAADDSYYSLAHHHFSYLDRSVYHPQLERYYEFLPRDQILVLESSALYREAAVTYTRVLEFLNLSFHRLTTFRNYSRPANAEPMNPKTRDTLAAYFGPQNESLFHLIGQEFDWH